MARDVIIATFENRNQAYDAARDIDKLDDSVIHIQSGGIVEKDMLGNVTLLDAKDLTSPWGTIGGLTGGTVLGALVGTVAGPVGTMTGEPPAKTTPGAYETYDGSGMITSSPGSTMARTARSSASLTPLVTSTSVAGSYATPYNRSKEAAMRRRSSSMPKFDVYDVCPS